VLRLSICCSRRLMRVMARGLPVPMAQPKAATRWRDLSATYRMRMLAADRRPIRMGQGRSFTPLAPVTQKQVGNLPALSPRSDRHHGFCNLLWFCNPIGVELGHYRNDLRQLAIGLRWLDKRKLHAKAHQPVLAILASNESPD
jgi:hypothetical protein